MKREELLRAIGEVDEELLLKRTAQPKKDRRLRLRRIVWVTVACALVIAIFALAAPPEIEGPVLRIYAPVELNWLMRAANCFCYYAREDATVMINYRDTDFQHGAYYRTTGMENELDSSHGLPPAGDIHRRQQSVSEYADAAREVVSRGAADVIFFYGCIYGGQCRYSIDFDCCTDQLQELNALCASCEAAEPLLALTADEEGNSYVFPLSLEKYEDGAYCVKTGIVVNKDRADPGLVADFLEYMAENVDGFDIAGPMELYPTTVLQQEPDARCAGLTAEPKPANIRGQTAAVIALALFCGLCSIAAVLLLVRVIRAGVSFCRRQGECGGPLRFSLAPKRLAPGVGLGLSVGIAGIAAYIHSLRLSTQPDVARWLFLAILSFCCVFVILFASMLFARVERYGDRILFETGLSFRECFTDEIERTMVSGNSFVLVLRQGKPVLLRKEMFAGLEDAEWNG